MERVLVLAAQVEELEGLFGPLSEARLENGFYRYDTINIGVAGSIDKRLKGFQIFAPSRACYHDVDATAFGYAYGQMCSMPLYYEADQRALDLLASEGIADKVGGLILSGDSFITKENLKPYFYERFEEPLGIDMESAAIAQVAYIAKIPFLILRAISDDCQDDSNKETYDNNLVSASKRAGAVCKAVVEMLFD